MGKNKKHPIKEQRSVNTRNNVPKAMNTAARKKLGKKVESQSSWTITSLTEQNEAKPEHQESEEASKDVIQTLEDENKRPTEHNKTQEDIIQGMRNEMKTLNERFDAVSKDLKELQEVNKKQKDSKVILEDIVETILEETGRKIDDELSQQEVLKSVAGACSDLEGSMASLQETIKIVFEDLERVQNREQVLLESVKRYEDEKEKEQETNLCIVCLQREIKIVFVPCGHLITCSDCSRHVNECPMCRQIITSRVQIFMRN